MIKIIQPLPIIFMFTVLLSAIWGLTVVTYRLTENETIIWTGTCSISDAEADGLNVELDLTCNEKTASIHEPEIIAAVVNGRSSFRCTQSVGLRTDKSQWECKL